MKRIGLLGFLFTVTACTGFGAADSSASSPAPSTPAAPTGDAPTAAPVVGTPTETELTEAYGVFVAQTGSDTAEGTRTAPLATIGKGLAAAKAAGKRLYVCQGTYAETVTLENGIPVVGGFDCTDAKQWKSTDARSKIVAPSSPAVVAKAITTATRVDHLEIVAPDATQPSGSSIGLLAVDAGGLTLANVAITAGRGVKGDDGVEAAPVTEGGNANGMDGKTEELAIALTVLPGSAGGTSTCGGGSGGAAGTGGLYQGSSYTFNHVINYFWYAAPGQAAADGEHKSALAGHTGGPGASAATWGQIDESGFTPANGAAGESGTPGEGGAGGAGKLPDYIAANLQGQYVHGWGGSGGGAGGCAGLAGTPGKGGGASIAIVAIRSAMTIDASVITASDGGAGGKGTFGSAATPGGEPGKALTAGTSGTHGGAGGESGTSGSGAGGPSIAIAHAGGAPTMTNVKTVTGKAGAGVPAMAANGKTIAASADGVAEEVHALD